MGALLAFYPWDLLDRHRDLHATYENSRSDSDGTMSVMLRRSTRKFTPPQMNRSPSRIESACSDDVINFYHRFHGYL